jgi:hypothetical protein
MKRKRKKAGKDSRYYLYVYFLPPYQSPREDMTYNSNDERGPQSAIKWLMKRVLNGTAKNRYSYAKLVDRLTGKILSVWTDTEGQMSWESYKELKESTKSPNERPYLKASVAFLPFKRSEREAYGLSPLLTVIGGVYDGISGEDAALLSIYEQVMFGKYSSDFRQVFIYDRNDIRVATLDRSGMTLTENFKKRIINAGNVEIPEYIFQSNTQLCQTH